MANFMYNPGNASRENDEDPYDFIILDEEGDEHNAYIPIGGGKREGKRNAAFSVTEGDEECLFDSSDFSTKVGSEMVGLEFDLEGGSSNNDSPEVGDKKISKLVTSLDGGTGLPNKNEETENAKNDGGTTLLPLELEAPKRKQAVSSTISRNSDRADEGKTFFEDRGNQPVLYNAKHDHDKSIKKMESESSNIINSDTKVTSMDNFSWREKDHLLTAATEEDDNNTQADDVGVSLSTTPSRLFQMGVIKDDMEEDEDYSNEEFEEDLEEDLNIKGNVVGDMQSSASIQLREDIQDRSSNKGESEYGGTFEEESRSRCICATAEGNESDYEFSFEEDSESGNFVIGARDDDESHQKDNGQMLNHEITAIRKPSPSCSHEHASPSSTVRCTTCISPPTLASKGVETITIWHSTESSYTVAIDRSEQEYDEDKPALLAANIPIKAQVPTEATLNYDFDPVKKIYRRSCGTQFSNNTAAVQANITSIGMIGATSSLDKHSTRRHSPFLPGRGGRPYIGRFASNQPPLAPSLRDPSIWAMPPNPPSYIPFYPSITHIERLDSVMDSSTSSEMKQLANNVLNANAPTPRAIESTSMEETGRVTTAAEPRLSIAMDDCCPTPLAISEAAFRRQLMLLRDNITLMKQRAEICTDIPSEQYSRVSSLMGTQHKIAMAHVKP